MDSQFTHFGIVYIIFNSVSMCNTFTHILYSITIIFSEENTFVCLKARFFLKEGFIGFQTTVKSNKTNKGKN